MNPRTFAPDPRPHKQHLEQNISPTEFGIFAFFAEILVAAMLLGIGVHFITTASEPDYVAWVAFALVAVLLVDGGRRLFKVATGKVRR